VLKETQNINLSPLRFLPELVKVVRGNEAHIVPTQEMTQLFAQMSDLAHFRKRKAGMSGSNNQGFLILLFLFLKLQGPVDLGMVSLDLSFTDQNLYSKGRVGPWDFYDTIYRLVIDPRRYLKTQILEDGMNGINQQQFAFRPE
jgi:hypothetical protein